MRSGNVFDIQDYVVYRNEVCFIKEIRKRFIGGKDYYVLSPSSDSSLTIHLPIDEHIRLKPIMTKQEAMNFIKSIPSILPIACNDKTLESEYKALLRTEEKKDLVRIIKTTYFRNQERLKAGRRVGEKDETYFNKAEKLLYNELAVSLGMNFEETKEFVIHTIRHM